MLIIVWNTLIGRSYSATVGLLFESDLKISIGVVPLPSNSSNLLMSHRCFKCQGKLVWGKVLMSYSFYIEQRLKDLHQRVQFKVVEEDLKIMLSYSKGGQAAFQSRYLEDLILGVSTC